MVAGWDQAKAYARKNGISPAEARSILAKQKKALNGSVSKRRNKKVGVSISRGGSGEVAGDLIQMGMQMIQRGLLELRREEAVDED